MDPSPRGYLTERDMRIEWQEPLLRQSQFRQWCWTTATRRGDVEMAQAIAKVSHERNFPDRAVWAAAAFEAAQWWRPEILQAIAGLTDLGRIIDKNGEGLIHASAVSPFRDIRDGDPQNADFRRTVDVLTAAGCPLDAACPNGVTPLLRAVMSWRPATALQLLEAGANPHSATIGGFTVASLAAERFQHELLADLARRGVSLADQRFEGGTLLHRACAGSETSVTFEPGQRAAYCRTIELLIQHGLSFDVPDANGFPPLFYAAESLDTDRILVALDYGADPSQPGRDGVSLDAHLRELGQSGDLDPSEAGRVMALLGSWLARRSLDQALARDPNPRAAPL